MDYEAYLQQRERELATALQNARDATAKAKQAEWAILGAHNEIKRLMLEPARQDAAALQDDG